MLDHFVWCDFFYPSLWVYHFQTKTKWLPFADDIFKYIFVNDNLDILIVISLRFVPLDIIDTLQWRHCGGDGISNHQPHDCLLNHLFRHRSKKTSKLCVTGLCEGNSPVTSEFPALRASNAENVSSWWHHHDKHHQPCDIAYVE